MQWSRRLLGSGLGLRRKESWGWRNGETLVIRETWVVSEEEEEEE